MRKALLRLSTKCFVDWLERKLPPSGQPLVHDLLARSIVFIDAIPDGIGPNFTDVSKLDAHGLKTSLDWVFKGLRDSNNGDTWAALATYLLSMLVNDGLEDILQSMVQPPEKNIAVSSTQ